MHARTHARTQAVSHKHSVPCTLTGGGCTCVFIRALEGSQQSLKEALPWFLSTLKHDHEVLILNKEEDLFQKSVQNVLKWCFYVATPTCSLSIPGLQVGAEPAEVSHTHTCCCMVKRGGVGINDVIITVDFYWAFWLSGFQLSERNQKYTGKTYSHIMTTPGGLLE